MATPPTYRNMWPRYAEYWDRMEISSGREAEVKRACEKILTGYSRYLAVQMATTIPAHMVGVLHMRESSCDFNRQLGQGDPLNKPSVNEPKGMGPYLTFEESAYDILVRRKNYNKQFDWRIEKILYYCENWNGWGYWMYRDNMPSPFIWGATNIQKRGKYVADNTWDAGEWDMQIGCAPMLKMLATMLKPITPSITFVRET